jgi:Domain of unknown function (DUF4954)
MHDASASAAGSIPVSLLAAVTARYRSDAVHSPLLASIKSLSQGPEWLRNQGRPLIPSEIETLIAQGNTCEAWARVRVVSESALTPIQLGEIRQSRFEGDVVITPPVGEGIDAQGRVWKYGIRHSLVRDCFIGQACIEGVGRLERYVVEDRAIIAHVSLMTCAQAIRFTLGQVIHPGDETGSRSLWFWDGLDLGTCELSLALSPGEQRTFAAQVKAGAVGAVQAGGKMSGELPAAIFGRVGRQARIIATRIVQDTWVGDGANIEGASLVSGSALLSSVERPCRIGAEARIIDSMLQAGCAVDAGGSVRRSLLLEASGVGESGKVIESVLGPNTHVEKGEATACLVGPFVGFHHQALLIAAIWPEGRGNVAYGANVGSNHTGKKPDQEIRPGEGMFFGLGCTVKFPANFSEAPYSLIASGVVTLPQRLRYPFSLVMAPSFMPSAETQGLNEIRPGFMWSDNLYALARNSFKYADRDKSVAHTLKPVPLPGGLVRDGFFGGRLFMPDIAAKVAEAYVSLRNLNSPTGSSLFLPKTLPGLGKNALRANFLESARQAYAQYLKVLLLRWGAEPAIWADAALRDKHCGAALAALVLPNDLTWRDQMGDWRGILLSLPDAVAASLERDDRRGQGIFDDYGAFHGETGPSDEAVVIRIREAVEVLAGFLEAASP